MSQWVLIIYLGFFQGYMQIPYKTEAECREAAIEWRKMNPNSEATLTCTKG